MSFDKIKQINIDENYIHVLNVDGAVVELPLCKENLVFISSYYKQKQAEHQNNLENMYIKSLGNNKSLITIFVGSVAISYVLNTNLYILISFMAMGVVELTSHIHSMLCLKSDAEAIEYSSEVIEEVGKILHKH